MEDQDSVYNILTGGQAIEVEVKIDLQSIVLLAMALIASIILGQVIAASITSI